jgi:hypothetical protein
VFTFINTFTQLQPKVVTDLDEEEIKKRMEELGLIDDTDNDGDENEEGMTAPTGLDDEVEEVCGFVQRFAYIYLFVIYATHTVLCICSMRNIMLLHRMVGIRMMRMIECCCCYLYTVSIVIVCVCG